MRLSNPRQLIALAVTVAGFASWLLSGPLGHPGVPGPTGGIARTKTGEGLIAFTLRDSAGRLQIFTANPDGSEQRQLTFEGDNGRPAWSPDGTRLAFVTTRALGVSVAIMDANGSQQIVLAAGDAPDWSHDSQSIAFSRGGQIWVMRVEGRELRQLTRSSTFKAGPSWSPDGTRMAFILIQDPQSPTSPRPTIGTINADGTNERILTPPGRVNVRIEPDGARAVLETADDANAPAWSPVGDRIAFWSGIEQRYGQVWVINADGSGSMQLTDDPTHRNSDDPSWSPDGRKILFSTGRSGTVELWVMNSDGTGQHRLFQIDPGPFPGRASWQKP
jgi:TolB protein